ncbi:YhgE/Pip domain-containing protein [Actinomycetes bacterium M1A6_2h]
MVHTSSPARRRWPVVVAVVAVLVLIGAVAFSALRGGTKTPAVLVLNDDAGVTVGATTVNAGKDFADRLTGSTEFDWTVASGDRPAGDFDATVTIPDGFSAALNSTTGARPEQAQMAVDGAVSPLLTALIDSSAAQTASTGVQGLITQTARARAQLQQALLPAQILSAATKGASAQGDQLLGSVETFLPFLETARSGADQLVAASDNVSRLVAGARQPTAELSARLNQAGLTIADVTRGADQLRGLLQTVQDTLTANGIDAAPVAQTRSDITLATSQLTSFSTLLGSGPDTTLGTAVQNGYDQLAEISTQLSSAGSQLQSAIGPIADGAPQLLGGAKDQILGAITQLSTLSDTISKQVTTGVSALPSTSTAQSTVLKNPVNVSYASAPAVSEGGTDWLPYLFGAVIVVLAGVLVFTTVRPHYRESGAPSVDPST